MEHVTNPIFPAHLLAGPWDPDLVFQLLVAEQQLAWHGTQQHEAVPCETVDVLVVTPDVDVPTTKTNDEITAISYINKIILISLFIITYGIEMACS